MPGHRRQHHPSKRHFNKLMLCEFLWKEGTKAEKRKNEPLPKEEDKDDKKEGKPGLAKETVKEGDIKREEKEEGSKSKRGDEDDADGGPKGETSTDEGKSSDNKEGEKAAVTTHSSCVSSCCLR
mmetsp:Transcript_61616/g.182072  ORF Transcript_61616/g.182072 Transcript_61616/m.182072 type:complete len:124 (-) Transcript_61616:95-466(-)